MQSVLIERLFGKKESHAAEENLFEGAVGWRYGLLFGVMTVLTGWGYDAFEQFSASAEMTGVKFFIVALGIVPLTTLAGLIAMRMRSTTKRLLVWCLFGGATGVVGLFLSYSGVSIVAMLFDPAVSGIWILPLTSGVIERLPLVTIFGAILGLFAGALQRLATNWAWDAASTGNRFTRESWLRLLVSLPIAFTLGALYDGSVNAQLRAPYQLTHRLIRVALTTPPDLDMKKMGTVQVLDYAVAEQWRKNFAPRYTHRLADFNPKTLNDAMVDVEFANGFIWRCDTTWNGYVLRGCSDLTKVYRDWMTQFIRTGAVSCEECFVSVEPAATLWHVQQKNSLGEPQQISLSHHAGGVVIVRATSANQNIECRFVGANPTIIRDCVKP